VGLQVRQLLVTSTVVLALCAGAPALAQTDADPGEEGNLDVDEDADTSETEPTEAARDEDEALAQFKKGAELAEQERWKEACDHFAKAHELGPTGGTRLRLADCYERLGELDKARTLYRELTTLPESEMHAERVAIARERLKRIDEKLEAEREAKEGANEQPRPVNVPPHDDEGPDPLGVAGGVLLGVGGAGLVVGAVLGGLALSQREEVLDACSSGVCPVAQQGNADEAKTKALAADLCLGLGGAVAAAGLVLLIVSITGEDAGDDVTIVPGGIAVRF
jgi:tetratricopeptide (TPR) repeat protein